MKTRNLFFGFLITLSFASLINSCTKDRMTGTSNPSGVVSSGVPITGAIVDLGVVSGDVRQMSVNLTQVTLTYDGDMYGDPVAGGELAANFLTQSDGIISDGTYLLSDTTNVTPFTFKSAMVSVPNSNSGSPDMFTLKDGSISVVRSDSQYSFVLVATLSNGTPVHAAYTGTLRYADNPSY